MAVTTPQLYLTTNKPLLWPKNPPCKTPHPKTIQLRQQIKEKIIESRRNFLDLSYDEPIEEYKEEKSLQQVYHHYERKTPKKISFKIKKTASMYRKNQAPQLTTINQSKVAQLTEKFNQLINENQLESPPIKFRQLVKRVNSFKTLDGSIGLRKITRTPSLKQKVKIIRKPSDNTTIKVQNKEGQKSPSCRSPDSKLCVRAKITYLDVPKSLQNLQKPLITPPNDKEVLKPTVPAKNFTQDTMQKIVENRKSLIRQLSFPKTDPWETPSLERPQTLDLPPKRLILDAIRPNSSFLWSRRPSTPYQALNCASMSLDSLEENLQVEYDDVDIPPDKNENSGLETSKEENQNEVPKSFLHQEKHTSVTPEVTPTSLEPEGNLAPSPFTKSFLYKNKPKPDATPPKAYEDLAKSPPGEVEEDKIYEELSGYEYYQPDDYEYCSSTNKDENIYETLPAPPLPQKRSTNEPLPLLPPKTIPLTLEQQDNCYESIYNTSKDYESAPSDYESAPTLPEADFDDYEIITPPEDTQNSKDETYESIYNYKSSKRLSYVSSDIQSNSIYDRSSVVNKMPNWTVDKEYNFSQVTSNYGYYKTYGGSDGKNSVSDLSSSSRSDEWIDVSDAEDNPKSADIIIIRERHKSKKSSGWVQKFREQLSKSPKKISTNQGADSDSDHHYESLQYSASEETQDCDYDSFDSDSDTDESFLSDAGAGGTTLPEIPQQTYVFTRLKASAGKHIKKLRRNWSVTKNDFAKSLSRMSLIGKSRTDLSTVDSKAPKRLSIMSNTSESTYQNVEVAEEPSVEPEVITRTATTTVDRKSFLEKFRKSMSVTPAHAQNITNSLEHQKDQKDQKSKSTFYVTEDINIDSNLKNVSPISHDNIIKELKERRKSSPGLRRRSLAVPPNRPSSPPPPTPTVNITTEESSPKNGKKSAWYAEVGIFKTLDKSPISAKQPSACWYSEVGLYEKTNSNSSPSTSSTENSGTNTSVTITPSQNGTTNSVSLNEDSDYYNTKNNSFYNESIGSEHKKDLSLNSLSGDADIQLRLQDEPLYQFYDAAVLESVCNDSTSDFDSDNYEDLENKRNIESQEFRRPSAMELITPNNPEHKTNYNRTLWCEIPEVVQSLVLSTLSTHQKKLQEAKFEILTSEASYLNSLNVLNDHFIQNLKDTEGLRNDEYDILFSKIHQVKECSAKLLLDLEKCWQDNILLHGICDIIQKHAEENFCVYIPYSENQIIIDDTLRSLKEKTSFEKNLRHLETSSTCHSLSLYSFLMLPMQRITRLPLLVDAVLKRLSSQDSEFLTCQYALATLNKIVNQCNEAARNKERQLELKKIYKKLDFTKVPPIEILSPTRWLVRSGSVTQMLPRSDDIKLTFGKRFSKVNLHLFLFNDLFIAAKNKCENVYSVIHYCPRNLIELSSGDAVHALPLKETTAKNLIFLTILENQDNKTIEMLLACNSESDKERWIEALTPPRSEDPDETLYECWDCPQVTAIHSYTAVQPDELALGRGDVINVLRKMVDGWYHGERIRDGQTGWFPANYTTEVANPHVRARNLKQRYRLLALSESYLKTK